MFRFIHAADPHLDSPLLGLASQEGSPVSLLRGATRRAFENLIRLAIDEKVDFVVIAGDLYDGDWKDYSTGLFFRGQMVRLRENSIPVYLIAGNHDAASVLTKRLSLPDNVHVFSTRTAESFGVEGLPVMIHGRGFPNRKVPENLASEYPEAAAGKFNIGLLHTSLNGRPGHDTYTPCSENDLQQKGYNYWALGHIHQPEIISRDPWIVFAGNCQGRHIKETGARGCQLVTVNDSLQVESVDWQTLDVVRWEELSVDLAGCDTDSDALHRINVAMEKAVGESDGRLVAARIALSGATPLHGSLHREQSRWHAEALAMAQNQGAEAIWIERVKIATTPVYDVTALAERDALTKTVLDSLSDLAETQPTQLAGISSMLDLLPSEVRREVETDFQEDQQESLLDDVRAIVVDALATHGGRDA